MSCRTASPSEKTSGGQYGTRSGCTPSSSKTRPWPDAPGRCSPGLIDAGWKSGIDTVDPMVAAVADAYDEPVLTANRADFEALGVAVGTY